MSECVFCKIGRHELEAMVVYEDERLIAFRDIDPQAPVHVLIIPKAHYESLNEFEKKDQALLGELILAGIRIARQERLIECGYRLILNTGLEAGQSVAHVHLHLMGGRPLAWPPG